jgi:hypothetical protein
MSWVRIFHLLWGSMVVNGREFESLTVRIFDFWGVNVVV